jgi:N-acetylmuramoyl-L-alanine amidase
MTELTLDREQAQTKLPKIVKMLMMMVFMSFALAASVWLLNWTVKDKLSKFEPMESSQITAEVRERQLSCLAKNIYYEAGGEPFEGKVAVAQVTINRAASGLFPDDICKTIYQKNVIYEKVICQFSWVCDRNSGVRPPRNAVYDESMAVAKKVLLEGFRLPGLTQAMYFHADYINPGWKRERVAKIGRHIFYK